MATITHPKSDVDATVVIFVLLAGLGVFAIAAGIAIAAGSSVIGAAGIGLFCSLWGGPGFGLMMVGARYAFGLERDGRD